MHMRLGSKQFGRFRATIANLPHNKKVFIPTLTLLLAGLTVGIFTVVRAITNTGDVTYIARKANSHAIYYGVIPENANQSWNTNWYTVTNTTQNTTHDAMCMQASRHQPGGTGIAYTGDSSIKYIMLATVPSYSAAGTTDYYTNFANWFAQNYSDGTYSGWQAAMRSIRNLAKNDTGVVYDGGDSGISDTDRIFAIGHMLVSGIYDAPNSPDNYYALNATDIANLGTIEGYINSYFGSLSTDPADEYETYRTWVDAETQTVGWLEYKGASTPVSTSIRLRKYDTNDNPLAGATFAVYYTDSTGALLGLVGSYTTGSDGFTPCITLDNSYANNGTIDIKFQETDAPAGYKLDSTLSPEAVAVGSDCSSDWIRTLDNERVAAGYIKIKKVDAEDSSRLSIGSATIVGAKYCVYDSAHSCANPNTTITIGADGTGTSTALSEGTYTIQESDTPSGYLLSAATQSATISASDDGRTIDLSSTPFSDTLIKGKISFTKTGYEVSDSGAISQRGLAGVSFIATNKSDSSITYTIGPTASDGSITSPDMVYGNYTVTEVRSSANSAYSLISFDASIASATTVNLGTKQDELLDSPEISTIARNTNSTFENPSKELEISASASVTDRITCSGLQNGAQYKLEGELWDIAANTPALTSSGASVTGASVFSANANGSCGNLDMVFVTFPSQNYTNKTLGIKQTLYKNNGTSSSPDWVRLLIHNDNLSDPDEQVTVKEFQISTLATTEHPNNKLLAVGTVKIKDTISTTSFINGQTYTIEGIVKTSSGATVATDSISYNMTAATGTSISTDLNFTFDSTPYVGQSLSITVTATAPGGYDLTHEPPADGSETVTVVRPEIGTSAVSGHDTSTKELEIGTTTIQDTVTYTYSDLVPGDPYTVKGEVHKLNADGTDSGTIVSTATKSFTASGTSSQTGSETLTFDIDTISACTTNNKLITPCKFVVYEYIYYGNHSSPFASHANPSDSAQIVSIKQPSISTVATDKQNNSKTLSIGTTTVIDKVSYSGLVAGQTYILKGQLVDVATGDVKATAIESFPAAASSGTVTVDSFSTFDTTLDFNQSLGNNQKTYVVYQQLYFGDIELVSHADSTDTDQQVQLAPPKIHTTATYKTDGSRLLGVGDVTIKDYVDYEGLVAGEYYTIVGTIFDPSTGTTLEIDGESIESTKTFKANTNGKGTITLEINLNTVSLQGHKFVVYERLYRSSSKHGDGRLLDVHEEALDEGDQTIGVKTAKIETLAKDKSDDNNVIEHQASQHIVDTVSYDGLLMGEDYTLSGYLYDKTHGTPLLDTNGHRIEATTTFTTSDKRDSGEIEMEFEVDASSLPGVEIVVFEYLYSGGIVPTNTDGTPDTESAVTSHEDPNDADQTVRVAMRVGTTAADDYDGDQTVGVGQVKIVDNLKYEGLTLGETYKAKGWLVLKDTGEPLDIVNTITFVVGTTGFEETTGIAKITFELDTRELIGQDLVVFEELYHVDDKGDEELVASHKDLDDEKQTITIATPKIHTTATDKSDGDKELANDTEAIIVDKVEYSGLVAGTTYTLHGYLVSKTTGERITASGVTEITITFDATRDAGTETMEFTVDTSGLAGKEFVVFEELYIDALIDEDDETGDTDDNDDDEEDTISNTKIAEHKDLDDENQTVWVKVIIPNTGLFTRLLDGAKQTGLLVIIGLLSVAALGFWGFSRVKSHRKINF